MAKGKASSQKFIARTRAPRVQIEYDLETYGAEQTINLPFVMGVMADLSGKPEEALPAVGERKFLEIDVDNFDERMKAAKPRVAFQVPNSLTGEGNINVDLTFESMDDFSPAAVAKKFTCIIFSMPPYRIVTSVRPGFSVDVSLTLATPAELVLDELGMIPSVVLNVSIAPDIAT